MIAAFWVCFVIIYTVVLFCLPRCPYCKKFNRAVPTANECEYHCMNCSRVYSTRPE